MAETRRVVFHEKMIGIRDRFGRDVRLEGVSEARRNDVPVRPIHHAMASVLLGSLGLLLITALTTAAVLLNGLATRTGAFSGIPVLGFMESSDGRSFVGYWLVGALLLIGLGSAAVFGSLVQWATDLYDRVVRMFSPPFTRRPYAVFLRRAQKTDAPGPLDLSLQAEVKFVKAFERIGPTVCHGTSRQRAEELPGAIRMIVRDQDTVWAQTVLEIEQDAAFIAVDVTEASARVLALVKRLANAKAGPRFGLLIALGTPERRMASWKLVAEAIAGTSARVSPVAPKAPPSVMLIDGSIWTAIGQAPHALGAAQLSVALASDEAQALFDVAGSYQS